MKWTILIFFFFFLNVTTYAQDFPSKLYHVSFEYGVHAPGADLKDRFGTNFQAGIHIERIQLKSGLLFGLSSHFLFGNVVKEDVLTNLRTSDGGIIGNDRLFATVVLRQRGLNTQAYIGKIFKVIDGHYSSGIKITIGAGVLQHKIRVQDDSRSVTELTGEYLKGYDRLTNGLAINTFIGYQHIGKNRRINFIAGFDFVMAFTQSRRDFDFALMMADETRRTDMLSGFKVGWMLPIGAGAERTPEEIIY